LLQTNITAFTSFNSLSAVRNGDSEIRVLVFRLAGWDLWFEHLSICCSKADDYFLDNKVVFCTGGAGTICSAQVRALVHLGANACIIGRNVEKTEMMAKSIATARQGAKVIGIGAVDVRKIENLESAVERCVKELGGIDYVM
jgi:hypothetical protein